MQDCASSNKIKENKYKILRMSLLLGADDNRQETINNFEDASRDIDAMNDEVYLKEIESKFYDTLKLEEEEKKLAVLVDYIGGRVEQRISLLSDFANVTGYDLQGLPPIKYYDKLDDYKERLKYIREYLSNIEQINKLDLEIEQADTKLNEAYLTKATSEEQNLKNEELLQTKFNNLVKNMDIFKDVTEENIEVKLNEVSYKVEDSKKSLDIFTKSFTTLSGSGISVEEEQEYLSYVEGAEEAFYNNKEEEYLLKIYHLLMEKNSEYNKLLIKREELNDILYERINLRKELKIPNSDILGNIYDLLEKQYDDIKRQSTNMNKIESLTNEISIKKEQLNELVAENQKVEILALLREFCIIDTYDEEENIESIKEETIEMPSEFEKELETSIEEISNIENTEVMDNNNFDINTNDLFKDSNFFNEEYVEEKIEETSTTEEIKDNQVIAVESHGSIDLDLVHSKAGKVMSRVGNMLGIKTEETKIVTVSNEPEQQPAPEPIKEEPKEEIKSSPMENPLFSDNLENTINLSIDPEFQNALNSVNTIDPEENNDFWFPSDTPDALNALPDLEISNDNLFLNNNISDLQFPDLNIDFGNNDSEGK